MSSPEEELVQMRQKRAKEAVQVAAREGGITGVALAGIATGVHLAASRFFPQQYSKIPSHPLRILAAVGILGGLWVRANSAYAEQLTAWHGQDTTTIQKIDALARKKVLAAALQAKNGGGSSASSGGGGSVMR